MEPIKCLDSLSLRQYPDCITLLQQQALSSAHISIHSHTCWRLEVCSMMPNSLARSPKSGPQPAPTQKVQSSLQIHDTRKKSDFCTIFVSYFCQRRLKFAKFNFFNATGLCIFSQCVHRRRAKISLKSIVIIFFEFCI